MLMRHQSNQTKDAQPWYYEVVDMRHDTRHPGVDTMPELIALGDVAAAVGCESWRLRRLFERGVLPEPQRVGGYRVFQASEIPTIRLAAEKAGILADQRRPVAV